MKTKILILSLIISGIGLSLWYFHSGKGRTASDGADLSSDFTYKEKSDGEVKNNMERAKQSTQKENNPTADSIQKKERLDNTVEFWKPRIAMFIQKHASGKTGEVKINVLALETTNLFQMLKEAANRQKRGLEPYTSVSEYKTMTTLMALEQEFETLSGLSFSNFIMTLDEASLMSLFDKAAP